MEIKYVGKLKHLSEVQYFRKRLDSRGYPATYNHNVMNIYIIFEP